MLGTTSLLFQNEFQDHTMYAGNGQILDLAESKSTSCSVILPPSKILESLVVQ